MNEQISDAVIILSLPFQVQRTDGFATVRLESDAWTVSYDMAKAKQAEIDCESEVTDDMVRAAYNVHNAASEACGFSTTFERCRGAIEAALKVSNKAKPQ